MKETSWCALHHFVFVYLCSWCVFVNFFICGTQLTVEDERGTSVSANLTFAINDNSLVNDEPPIVNVEPTVIYFMEDSSEALMIAGGNSSITDNDDYFEHDRVDRICASIINPSDGDLINSSSSDIADLPSTFMICINFTLHNTQDNQTYFQEELQSLTYTNTIDEPVLSDRIISLKVMYPSSNLHVYTGFHLWGHLPPLYCICLQIMAYFQIVLQ